MLKSKIFFIALITLLLIGCFRPYTNRERLSLLYPEIAVSNSDSLIYLTVYKDGFTELHEKHLIDSMSKKILGFANTYITNADQYGEIILFDKNMKDTNCICYFNKETGTVSNVYCGEHTAIMECKLTNSGKEAVFTVAKYYGNYSPIARPGYHNYDIYSVNIDGSGFKQLTNKNYYSLSSLSPSKSNSNIYYIASFSAENNQQCFSGIFCFNLENSDIKRIYPPELPNRKHECRIIYEMTTDNMDSLLFFTSYGKGNDVRQSGIEIFSLDLKTNDTKQLTLTGKYCQGLRMTKDGTQLYYLVDAGYPTGPIRHELRRLNIKDGTENIIPIGQLGGNQNRTIDVKQ